MSKDVKINELEDSDSGEFLFVYSDRYNVFVFFRHIQDNKLYKITTDKLLNIEHIDEISVPDGFFNYKTIKFFKPLSNGSDHDFIGIVVFDDISYKFNIAENNNDTLKYTEEVDYKNNNKFNMLSCIKDIDIVSYIQKGNKVYLVGTENKHIAGDPIFGVLNIEKDCLDNVYYLYSDNGEIELKAINIDTDDHKVYVVGSTVDIDKEGIIIDKKPYFESFILRN